MATAICGKFAKEKFGDIPLCKKHRIELIEKGKKEGLDTVFTAIPSDALESERCCGVPKKTKIKRRKAKKNLKKLEAR